jgi:hypothetical protein
MQGGVLPAAVLAGNPGDEAHLFHPFRKMVFFRVRNPVLSLVFYFLYSTFYAFRPLSSTINLRGRSAAPMKRHPQSPAFFSL